MTRLEKQLSLQFWAWLLTTTTINYANICHYIIKCRKELEIIEGDNCLQPKLLYKSNKLSFLSFFAYELNNSLHFCSQSGHFPLMLAAHPGVIEALHKAVATEQVKYRMLYVRCYWTRSCLQ